MNKIREDTDKQIIYVYKLKGIILFHNTQSDLQIQCILIKISMSFFTEIEKTILKQNINGYNNLEKEKQSQRHHTP